MAASDVLRADRPATASGTGPVLRPRRQYLGRRLTHHLILILISLAFLAPFLVMITTAFKTSGDIFRVPPRLLPDHWVLGNFAEAVQAMPFLRYLANTVLLVVVNVAGTLISCPLVAYGLAKLHWRGRSTVFGTVLATMMLPAQVTFIPLYLLWDRLGAVGTLWPLIIPAFFGSPFYIFLLRQFFTGVPDSLREAGLIDGASEFRVYLQLILPQAKAAIATVAVFQFVATWTDFLLPLIYLNSQENYTLSIGLYNFFGEHGVAWGPLMAACLVFTLPALAIFMVAQRYFVQGISVTGIK
ncbi:multiple sugar transport system permease protein [Actinopolymorpha cephalotaxi]|uniref:Multiple sugar transport system permease protein n=1 Tax=Actinopolymorpha cephalotaxi TaxID=504797 RepID=A0A1I3A608_9ACTN|nr:carbohydrate ABC transporter permease [Actinopolymorpha cephalotaxi]NYH85320.1 multiple sugar transport system permease protein [Actinopolymorpha cephalotaxi]SFH45547.1 multiple sugar transport system permease protein [Actinopolymorpha cephalotaxi]